MVKQALKVSMIFSLLVTPGATTAAQNPEGKCDGTNLEISICLDAAYKAADAELNAAYQQALKRAAQYSGTDVGKLRAAERAWIAYRDADCEAERGLWGRGSGGPNAYAMCRIALTMERTEHLKSGHGF